MIRQKLYIIVPLLLALLTANAQDRLSVGYSIDPLFCISSANSSFQGDDLTSSKLSDLFNYKLGLIFDYQFDFGMALSSGFDVSRNRFAFIHSQVLDEGPVELWGHGESYKFSLPLLASYRVYTSNDPFFEILPQAGLSIGRDFSVYRNMTRLDHNYDYDYVFEKDTYNRISTVISVHAGVQFRSNIEQLGLIYWQFMLGRDLSKLPDFNYIITSAGGTEFYREEIRLNYVSFGMSMFFRSWDLINGKLRKRR